MRFRRVESGAVTVVLIFLLALNVTAQNSQPQNTPPATQSQQSTQSDSGPIFKSTVRRVVIDVVVTKANGEPVRGLLPQDFTVFEDGKQQTIRSFEPHELPVLKKGSAPVNLPPNSLTNAPAAPQHGPTNIILLDYLNTHRDAQQTAYQGVQQFAKNMPPGSRVALFALKRKLRLLQGVTEDRTQILSAIRSKGAWPYESIATLEEGELAGERLRSTIDAFAELAKFLSDVPGRKNLIWLSNSFFVPNIAFLPNGTSDLQRQSSELEKQVEAIGSSRELKKVTVLFTTAQVAIYPIDVCDLHTSADALPDHAKLRPCSLMPGPFSSGLDRSYPSSGRPGSGDIAAEATREFNASLNNLYQRRVWLSSMMQQVAEDSGGRAFYESNRPDLDLLKSINEGSYYYTISYDPTNKVFNGATRNIKVQVEKHGYRLSYRRSYLAIHE